MLTILNMDPARNPYAPGAGVKPPALTGRDQTIQDARIALGRIGNKRPARGIILYGLRGVGKTVLLREMQNMAKGLGFQTYWLEAPEKKSLPATLAPALRSILLRLGGGEASSQVKKALGVLASFVSSMKMKYNDLEFSWNLPEAAGIGDSGDLEIDLTDLFLSVGEAALEKNTVVSLFIDELQHIPEEQLGALISALHQTSQRALPVTLMGAGLPQILAKSGKVKSYAERLFKYVEVGALEPDAARAALTKPAEQEGVEFTQTALDFIIRETHRYPYFLQEWGSQAWDIASCSPIDIQEVERASDIAVAELDASFFRVRFDRMTPAEKNYVHAMARLGEGPHRSKEIAKGLGKDVKQVAPFRSSLIAKGMIFSPAHGDTAFTVPLFDQFILRTWTPDS